MTKDLQHEIVTHLANGLSNKEIGEKMRYTQTSIQTFIIRIRKEYGAKNACHLVHIFHTKNLL